MRPSRIMLSGSCRRYTRAGIPMACTTRSERPISMRRIHLTGMAYGGTPNTSTMVATPAGVSGIPRTEQNYRVLAYIGRAMLWSVTELGFDGFRIDHTYGMPFYFFEQTLPWVEAKARQRRGNLFSLILVHEDHDRKDYTARVGDVVQSKGYEGLVHALTQQDI